MDLMRLEEIITLGWENRDSVKVGEHSQLSQAVDEALSLIDAGKLRVAEFKDGDWQVNTWAKKAVLLSFRLKPNAIMPCGTGIYDKVPLKFENWDNESFQQSAIRAVPGSIVRHGSYIAPNVVLMPSFVNIGAFVDEGTMVDTWATIGSCAQVGKNCHISGGVGIGGVLEPLQANPVIIEDNVFIGARSEVVEGVRVETGSVIGMGVFLGASTPIVNRATGETSFGRIPPYSVVIAGTLPGKPLPDGSEGPGLACAVIVKQVDAQTRSKTALNELLRP